MSLYQNQQSLFVIRDQSEICNTKILASGSLLMALIFPAPRIPVCPTINSY